MNELREYIVNKKHHQFRVQTDYAPAKDFCRRALSPIERMTERFEKMCAMQQPVFLPNEKICLIRTHIAENNEIFTQEEWHEIKEKHYIHELGYLSNLSPDYERVIGTGLEVIRETADEYGKRVIDAILALCDRYRAAAIREGREEIAEVLARVPRYSATNFREALQFFRILHFALWLENDYHNTIGRFDQYMYPYFIRDMQKNIYSEESARELIEDFFLSFNKDSDLYVGQQQGDNGQSLVLGGRTEEGIDGFNELSRLCLQASCYLKLIDPKINLRVSRATPLEIYKLGSELTKAGLGFPQYSNDDIVIDALVSLGYDKKDAINYVVAACWEFIIPCVGADVANIGALSFPAAVNDALHSSLIDAVNFEDFMCAIQRSIKASVDNMCARFNSLWFVPSPFMRLLMDCENIANGAKYNNFGIHGAGVATAADSLAAIKKYIFDEKKITPKEMIEAVDTDFASAPDLIPLLRYEAPKMGQDDNLPDGICTRLLDMFADALRGKINCRGGIYRAGTGTAMYYLWFANELPASPDGRRKGEAFGTNFSASLFAKTRGPVSVIKSFTKQHLANTINGGPLTLEFHSSMFTDPECVEKVARTVKMFVNLGGHQLQLNVVNLDAMLDAQIHPELHRQLVVRIWGWSAYFVELDREFQDHVIARQEYRL